MRVSRRQALGLGAAATGTALLTGCGRLTSLAERDRGPVAPPSVQLDPAVRYLSRLGYGPRPGEAEEADKAGLNHWARRQMEPGEEPMSLMLAVRRLEAYHLSPFELRDLPVEHVLAQAQMAKILLAAHSPWQMRERLVDFWGNHFNIYASKGLSAYRIPWDERTVIREKVFGSFGGMLRASAKSTAMLVYLDQQASHYGNPNENYARELLELHTLGVDGGYTQQDVMEVARCFTGWTEERRFLRPKGQFRFDPELHDKGEKVVLGHRISGGGVEEGEKVLQILLEHPATARHLAGKLASYFVGEEAAETLAPRLEKRFAETNGQMKPVLKEIAESPELLEGPPTPKRPFDFMVGTLRTLDGTTDGGEAVRRALEQMGQPPYQWPMPDGYPMEAEAWGNSLLGRWNFVLDLLENQVEGTSVDAARLQGRYGFSGKDGAHAVAFGKSAEQPSQQALRQAVEAETDDFNQRVALYLCSPENQWR
jgi:uncharacterized protein (DUF1800 family)